MLTGQMTCILGKKKKKLTKGTIPKNSLNKKRILAADIISIYKNGEKQKNKMNTPEK